MSKPKVIKDYNKVPQEILEKLNNENPYGFENKLVTFKNAKGKLETALPYEAEDFFYMIRMTRQDARLILENETESASEAEVMNLDSKPKSKTPNKKKPSKNK